MNKTDIEIQNKRFFSYKHGDVVNFHEDKDELIPPLGMKYAWGIYSIDGETDHASILRLWSKGYKPVPPQRHPYAFSDNSVGGFISRKGSILLEITEREHEVHNKRLDYINEEIEKNPLLIGIRIKDNRQEYIRKLNSPIPPEIEIN